MKRLWAPWRMEYILDDKKHGTCLFCDISQTANGKVNKAKDKRNLILHRGRHCFVMLNKYPYNSGHSYGYPIFSYTYI